MEHEYILYLYFGVIVIYLFMKHIDATILDYQRARDVEKEESASRRQMIEITKEWVYSYEFKDGTYLEYDYFLNPEILIDLVRQHGEVRFDILEVTK